MYMIKAIFLDFDSTLFSHVTKKIPDSAYEAVLKAQKNNIKVFLATGRDIKEIEYFDTRNIKFDGYVLDDGQLLLDKDLNTLEVIYMTGKDRDQVINLFNNNKYPVMIRTREEGFINYLNETTIKTLNDVDSEMPPVKDKIEDNILVATIFTENEEEKKQIISDFKNSNVTWWHDNSCDVVPKQAHKMRGILRMLEITNLNKDEVLACGDGENDIEMISTLPHSVAMGNSVPSIKKAAEFITADIDDNGLEKAFKHYNII